jgi:hypothetical protein
MSSIRALQRGHAIFSRFLGLGSRDTTQTFPATLRATTHCWVRWLQPGPFEMGWCQSVVNFVQRRPSHRCKLWAMGIGAWASLVLGAARHADHLVPHGVRFDPETKRVLGLALEIVCLGLRVGDCDDGVKQAIAAKLIALVKAGECNPDILCEQVLTDIRQGESQDVTATLPPPHASLPAHLDFSS